jgi:hypothetical protein
MRAVEWVPRRQPNESTGEWNIRQIRVSFIQKYGAKLVFAALTLTASAIATTSVLLYEFREQQQINLRQQRHLNVNEQNLLRICEHFHIDCRPIPED